MLANTYDAMNWPGYSGGATMKELTEKNRRNVISKVELLLGGTILGAELFITGCTSTSEKVDDLFAKENVAFMNEIADTILPAKKTPGAKAVDVGHFMAVMVRDCYTPADQVVFMEGLSKVNEVTQKKFDKDFVHSSPLQRIEVLILLDKEQKLYTKTKKETNANHYFRMLTELTLLGYLTSEIDCIRALRFCLFSRRDKQNPGFFEDIKTMKTSKVSAGICLSPIL